MIEFQEFQQITNSSTAELLDRLAALRERFQERYTQAGLREYHLIRSELYCRENGITSEPGVCYSPPTRWQPKVEVKG